MMKCTQCDSLNEAGARFCGECGTGLAAAVEEVQQAFNQQAAAAQPDAGAANAGGSDYVEQGKAISRQYLSFAKEAIKAPMAASKRVTEGDKINGIISHTLFALLLPLFSYLAARNVSGGYVEIPFGSVVIQPFFILMIYLAVYSAVVFGVARLMKSNISYIEVMSRFGVFNVLPAAFMLLAVVFSMLSAIGFSFILFGISLALFINSSLSVIFSVKENNSKGIDVFYGLIIANAAMFIIFLVIGDSIIGNLRNQLENSLLYGLL